MCTTQEQRFWTAWGENRRDIRVPTLFFSSSMVRKQEKGARPGQNRVDTLPTVSVSVCNVAHHSTDASSGRVRATRSVLWFDLGPGDGVCPFRRLSLMADGSLEQESGRSTNHCANSLHVSKPAPARDKSHTAARESAVSCPFLTWQTAMEER